ncbi:MAG: hypothetical protein IKE53_09670 [Clostridiales bacterium]|nr:hypothetical protein [Clostridiales bacterium]
MYSRLRDSFLDGLSSYYGSDVMPAGASVNMRRALAEHRNRLRDKGLTYKETYINTIDDRPGETPARSETFNISHCYKHCNVIAEYSDGSNTVKLDESPDDIVYVQVIDLKDRESADQILVCPNCGHRSVARDFADGCPMCSTKFKISEIYPSVNSYYSIPWPMPKKDFPEQAMKVAKWIGIGGGLLIGLIALIGMLMTKSSTWVTALISIVVALVSGWGLFILSYLISMAVFSGKAVSGAARLAADTLDMAGAQNSQRQTEQAVCQFDKNFNYRVFEGQILSAIRSIAYSSDRQNCSVYTGTGDLSFMDDLVDIRYRGACRFEKAVAADGYLHVIMTAFLDNIYYREGSFSKARERFTVEMVRRQEVQTVPDISAHSINCGSCGASFDAVISRKCPYCGTPYALADHDWSVILIAR